MRVYRDINANPAKLDTLKHFMVGKTVNLVGINQLTLIYLTKIVILVVKMGIIKKKDSVWIVLNILFIKLVDGK